MQKNLILATVLFSTSRLIHNSGYCIIHHCLLHKYIGHFIRAANRVHVHNTQTVLNPMKNMVKFKYLKMTLINQNCTSEETKNRLHSRNACYYSTQNLLSFLSLSKGTEIPFNCRIPSCYVLTYNYRTNNPLSTQRAERGLLVSLKYTELHFFPVVLYGCVT
jgi:hypothetical protein